jgi:dTDP-4-amino-4,6-dideoxygalactose transaminase
MGYGWSMLKVNPPPTVQDKTWPVFDEEMVEAAARVLRSGKVNYWAGVEGRRFEAEFARFLDVPYALALTNGTAALELGLRALGIGPGDDVITTPRSFIASASCIVMCGARPVFAEVAEESGTIVAETIEAALTPATRAIVVVHLGGWPCDLDPILELARRHDIKVVEDAAQALGGTYKGRPLGSIGDAGAFSFCGDKILSTGEGGLLATNDDSSFKGVWGLRDHGRSWDAMQDQADGPGYKWVRETFGTNCRISEVQAAIGRVGLRRLPNWLARRRENAHFLAECLRDVEALRIPRTPDGHAHYVFYAYVRPERLTSGWTRDRILAELLSRNIPCSSGICGELYLEKAFERAGLRPENRLPMARELGETSLAFPVHPALGANDMHEIGDAVRRVLKEATS